MKKSSILAIWLSVCLAGCEIDGDTYPSAAPLTPSAEGVLSDVASAKDGNKTEEGKEARVPLALEQALELKSGIYGIPFGATTDDLMKWCNDNNMAVANPTEEDVKKDVKRAVGRIRDLKEAYDFEMVFLTPLEQELLKLAQGYANGGDMFERAKVAAAQEKIEVLKNPTVSYRDQKHYLERVHNGMNIEVDGEVRTCTDERITRTAYSLTLKPTERSEKLTAAGLNSINVFFRSEIGQELRAYATFAVLGGNAQRSANAQFELVLTAIREKYGAPTLIPRCRLLTAYFNSGESLQIIADDMSALFGTEVGFSFFSENETVAWARNLILFGNLRQTAESRGIALDGSEFLLFYYDHYAATQIFDLHARALADFKKDYHDKKKEALTQMQQDF